VAAAGRWLTPRPCSRSPISVSNPRHSLTSRCPGAWSQSS